MLLIEVERRQGTSCRIELIILAWLGGGGRKKTVVFEDVSLSTHGAPISKTALIDPIDPCHNAALAEGTMTCHTQNIARTINLRTDTAWR